MLAMPSLAAAMKIESRLASLVPISPKENAQINETIARYCMCLRKSPGSRRGLKYATYSMELLLRVSLILRADNYNSGVVWCELRQWEWNQSWLWIGWDVISEKVEELLVARISAAKAEDNCMVVWDWLGVLILHPEDVTLVANVATIVFEVANITGTNVNFAIFVCDDKNEFATFCVVEKFYVEFCPTNRSCAEWCFDCLLYTSDAADD